MRPNEERFNMLERDRNLINFTEVAQRLGVSQGVLARMLREPKPGTLPLPAPVSTHRRGYWRKTDIAAYLRQASQQMNQPNPSGPRAA